jgi:group I intron endonuclease
MKIAECGFVYMITCIITGRIYVGSAVDIEERWRYYFQLNCKHQTKLYNNLNKYGTGNHIFEIVWAGELSEMYKYETLIGWGFNVLEKETGLNLRLPKFGDSYSCMNEETRLKIGISSTGRIKSELTRAKLSKANKGKKRTQETKNKLSSSLTGRDFSEEHKNNISISKVGDKNYFYNMKISKEILDKRANTRKKPVLQFDMNDVFIKEWSSALDVFKELNIDKERIGACCRNYKWCKSAGGFKWKYKNKK